MAGWLKSKLLVRCKAKAQGGVPRQMRMPNVSLTEVNGTYARQRLIRNSSLQLNRSHELEKRKALFVSEFIQMVKEGFALFLKKETYITRFQLL